MNARALLSGLLVALALPAIAAEPRATPPSPAAPVSRTDRARSYFTDSILLDQDGRAVRFYRTSSRGTWWW